MVRKCPVCNSTRLTKVIVGKLLITTCQKCDYQNKKDVKLLTLKERFK